MSPGSIDLLVVGDGTSMHTRRHAQAIADRGLRVELAAFEGDQLRGVPTHGLGNLPFTADRRYPLAIPRLARLVRSRRPRIVHAHYVSSYGLMTAAAVRLAHPIGRRPRFVQSAWGADLLLTARSSRIWGTATAVALRCADLVTGDSVDLDAEAARLAPDVPRIRFAWGPPRSLFDAPTTRKARIVVARRLDPQMRVDLVVRAFRHARATDASAMDEWRLDVVGDGPDRALVEEASAGDSAVTIHGPLDLDALRHLLLRSAVLVNVPAADATSAILLDGLAIGLLPVVNDLPAYAEWIDPSIGEVVSRDPTVEELAAALGRAVRRDPDVARIQARAEAVAWERQIDELMDAYRALGARVS